MHHCYAHLRTSILRFPNTDFYIFSFTGKKMVINVLFNGSSGIDWHVGNRATWGDILSGLLFIFSINSSLFRHICINNNCSTIISISYLNTVTKRKMSVPIKIIYGIPPVKTLLVSIYWTLQNFFQLVVSVRYSYHFS